MDENNEKISIFVSSCDKYAWLWDIFFEMFEKHWPDCPYTIYLSSNTVEYKRKNVNVIFSGPDENWSRSLYLNLEKVHTPFILYIQDDFILEKDVNTNLIQQTFKLLKENHGSYVKLNDKDIPDVPDHQIFLNPIRPGQDYRLSLQAALWDKSFFQTMIKDGETPWEFEQNSVKKTIYITDKIYAASHKLLTYYYGGIAHRGKIPWNFYLKLKKNVGLIDRTKLMDTISFINWIIWYVYEKIPFKNVVPINLVLRIKNSISSIKR